MSKFDNHTPVPKTEPAGHHPIAIQTGPLEDKFDTWSWWRDGRITRHRMYDPRTKTEGELEVLATERFDWTHERLIQFQQEITGQTKGRVDYRGRLLPYPDPKIIQKRRTDAEKWRTKDV